LAIDAGVLSEPDDRPNARHELDVLAARVQRAWRATFGASAAEAWPMNPKCSIPGRSFAQRLPRG
jgi:hypothetical protein